MDQTSLEHRIWLLEGEVTTLYEEQLRDLTLSSVLQQASGTEKADLSQGDKFLFSMRKGFLPIGQQKWYIEQSCEFPVIGHVLIETGQSILKDVIDFTNPINAGPKDHEGPSDEEPVVPCYLLVLGI